MQAARDVGGAEPGAAVPHPGVVHGLVGIAPRAGDGDVQRTGHRGLLPAGVRRAMLAGVADHHPPCPASIRGGQQAGRGHEVQAREAGGQPVDQVVEPGGGRSEVPVALGPVADRAVQGVHRLVREEPRQSGDRVPEQGRRDPVGEVLRHRFDGAAGDPGLVQDRGVPAHDVTHRLAARGEALLEAPDHRAGMVVETAECDQGARDHRLQQPAEGPALDQEAVDRPRRRDAGACHHDHRRRAPEHAEPARRGRVQETFREPGQLAEHHHRMRHAPVEPRGIAGGRVDEQGRQHHVKFKAGSAHGGGITPQRAGQRQERTR